jgi:hypothetical protein
MVKIEHLLDKKFQKGKIAVWVHDPYGEPIEMGSFSKKTILRILSGWSSADDHPESITRTAIRSNLMWGELLSPSSKHNKEAIASYSFAQEKPSIWRAFFIGRRRRLLCRCWCCQHCFARSRHVLQIEIQDAVNLLLA